LVPGCGRGYDAILFAQRGFEVTAVDFAEGAMTATKTLAASRAVSVQLIQRNIFDLTPDFNQHFDYVVEHTCFCALAPHLRSAYVDLMAALLQPAGHFLGIFFTHQRPGGPPYGITPAEVRLLFEPNFDILSLQPVANSVPSRAGEEHLGWFQLQDS
jgi:SAM-dependent methyltransferase